MNFSCPILVHIEDPWVVTWLVKGLSGLHMKDVEWKSEANQHPPEPPAIENHVIDIAWKEASMGTNGMCWLQQATWAETGVFQLT